MTTDICIAVCADRHIEIGLHVTLYSLMRSTKRHVKIYFVHKGYGPEAIELLHKSLENFAGRFELIPIAFDDVSAFGTYRGLHGNTFTFVRLMLGALVPNEKKIIYIDSDIAVAKDLGELFDTDLGENVIGASMVGTIEASLECSFFKALGLKGEAKYFNAGVLLIDLDKWRSQSITAKCIEFAEAHSGKLPGNDQTMLNYVFYPGNFLELDAAYNWPLYPDSDPISTEMSAKVFHFVGAPKPWDFAGEFVHPNYLFFSSFLKHTSFRNYKTYLDLSWFRIQRTLRLARSYYRCLTRQSGRR